MNCLHCPEVTAGTEGLGQLLCVQHLLVVLKRRWPRCPTCGRPLYLPLDPPKRTQCARCTCTMGPTVNVTTAILPVPIRRGVQGDWSEVREAGGDEPDDEGE